MMGKYPKAKVVPFSSVVGSSVTLHDPETERVIGQLAVLNVGGDTHEDWKQRNVAVAEDTARRINAHDDLVEALEEAKEALSYAIRGTANAEQSDKYAATIAKVDAAIAKAVTPSASGQKSGE
jgi:hypothetical protein